MRYVRNVRNARYVRNVRSADDGDEDVQSIRTNLIFSLPFAVTSNITLTHAKLET
jgi:hypothetical protein